MVNESVALFGADLSSLSISGVEVMSRELLLEVRFGALQSTLMSNSTRITELESHLALSNSEIDAAMADQESTELFFGSQRTLLNPMWGQVKNQGPSFVQ